MAWKIDEFPADYQQQYCACCDRAYHNAGKPLPMVFPLKTLEMKGEFLEAPFIRLCARCQNEQKAHYLVPVPATNFEELLNVTLDAFLDRCLPDGNGGVWIDNRDKVAVGLHDALKTNGLLPK